MCKNVRNYKFALYDNPLYKTDLSPVYPIKVRLYSNKATLVWVRQMRYLVSFWPIATSYQE